MLALLSLIFVSSGCAQSETISIAKGQKEIVIKIPGNPTTGFQWQVKQYDENLFELKASGYLPPDNQRIGAGSVYQFVFTILKPLHQKTSITLEYKRPWEKKSGSVKTYLVTPVEEKIEKG